MFPFTSLRDSIHLTVRARVGPSDGELPLPGPGVKLILKKRTYSLRPARAALVWGVPRSAPRGRAISQGEGLKMAKGALVALDLVHWVADEATGLTTWRIGYYSFAWDGTGLYLSEICPAVPLAEIGMRELAIEFSAGFVAGRCLNMLAGEAVRIVSG